jgi:hypothetical protein
MDRDTFIITVYCKVDPNVKTNFRLFFRAYL